MNRPLTSDVHGRLPPQAASPDALAPQVPGGWVWTVGKLMRAVADALAARFNPVQVQGEMSGFTRAASGHCYFSLKDASGQVRCAMFRRAATSLAFAPRDGDLVEVQGKLDVYGPRGDLQLIVESMCQAGQGNLYEQFVQLKARLQALGLFEAGRKKTLHAMPQSIGVVTSLGAAALRDVATALARRVPHIPVTVYPASVQGQQAPAELCAALGRAYADHARGGHPQVLLLVRGGGSLEDLWAFNAEPLAHLLAQSPMPVVCGVGHETDFTIADFVADLRAPTPTAAAELCATDREAALGLLTWYGQRLTDACHARLDTQAQRLDRLGQRLARSSDRLALQQRRLQSLSHGLQQRVSSKLQQEKHDLKALEANFPVVFQRQIDVQRQRLLRSEALLNSLDPRLVLQRGFVWLADGDSGQPVVKAADTHAGQRLRATLADGEVDLTVR